MLYFLKSDYLKKQGTNCFKLFIAVLCFFPSYFEGVFRALSNICDGVFLPEAVIYFCERDPLWMLNTFLYSTCKYCSDFMSQICSSNVKFKQKTRFFLF